MISSCWCRFSTVGVCVCCCLLLFFFLFFFFRLFTYSTILWWCCCCCLRFSSLYCSFDFPHFANAKSEYYSFKFSLCDAHFKQSLLQISCCCYCFCSLLSIWMLILYFELLHKADRFVTGVVCFLLFICLCSDFFPSEISLIIVIEHEYYLKSSWILLLLLLISCALKIRYVKFSEISAKPTDILLTFRWNEFIMSDWTSPLISPN